MQEGKEISKKPNYIGILAPKWKQLISFVLKRKEDNYIQIVEAEFNKLILSVLADTLNLNKTYEDEDIKFSLKIKFENLGSVLKYMGKSTLYNKMFDPGEILEDGTIINASKSTWDQGTGELRTTMKDEQELCIKVRLNFKTNTVDANINWATIKQILPFVDKEMGLILAMTSLGGVEIKK
jgi:hypothetical protein